MPTAGGAREPGRSFSSSPSPLVPPWRWRRVFPGHGRELAEMRRWLSSMLPDCPARSDVLSVASELGSNAIEHTASGQEGGWFAVEVAWWPSMVELSVADGGGAGEPRMIDDPGGERGRGLQVVQGLSLRSGHVGDRRGRLAWAQVAWPQGIPAAADSLGDPVERAAREGEAELARRFAGVQAWFGRSTMQWWAMRPAGLVSVPTARELSELLGGGGRARGPVQREGELRGGGRARGRWPGGQLRTVARLVAAGPACLALVVVTAVGIADE